MGLMENVRRRRFVLWFAARYKGADDARARFIRESGERGFEPLTKGRVTQLFDEDEPFGEMAARNLAQRFGLPDDYFEREHGEDGTTPVLVSDDELPLVLAYLEGLRKRLPEPSETPLRRRAAKTTKKRRA